MELVISLTMITFYVFMSCLILSVVSVIILKSYSTYKARKHVENFMSEVVFPALEQAAKEAEAPKKKRGRPFSKNK